MAKIKNKHSVIYWGSRTVERVTGSERWERYPARRTISSLLWELTMVERGKRMRNIGHVSISHLLKEYDT